MKISTIFLGRSFATLALLVIGAMSLASPAMAAMTYGEITSFGWQYFTEMSPITVALFAFPIAAYVLIKSGIHNRSSIIQRLKQMSERTGEPLLRC